MKPIYCLTRKIGDIGLEVLLHAELLQESIGTDKYNDEFVKEQSEFLKELEIRLHNVINDLQSDEYPLLKIVGLKKQ